MKRLLVVALVIAVFAVVGGLTVVSNVTAQDPPAVEDCSWGEIKCCYSGNPCGGACCSRPKDDG